MSRFRLALRLWRYRLRERLPRRVAWVLPRSVAYWATIRVGAYATDGEYGNTNPSELRLMDALNRWGGPQ